jgi:regulator of sigma E protease
MGWVFTLLGFTALVFVHELGHFLAGKAVGMRVERFSLFFGPRILRLTRGETEYSLGAIPVGGFVKIAGMSPSEMNKIDLRVSHAAYYHQAVWKRLVVILAGPAMNVLAAILIIWGLNLYGYQQRPIYRTQAAVRSTMLPATGRHDIAYVVDPQRPGGEALAALGVGGYATGANVGELWSELKETLSLIPRLFTSEDARAHVHSVIGISSMTDREFNASFPSALHLLALLSLSLAIMNLLPIFPLDGGHIAWALAEWIRGRRISFKVMNRVSMVGFAAVLALLALGVNNDLRGPSTERIRFNRSSPYRYCRYQPNGSQVCWYGGPYTAPENQSVVPPRRIGASVQS